jgi:hypothetical protein
MERDKFCQEAGEFNVEEIMEMIKKKAGREKIKRILEEMRELAKVEMNYKIKSHRRIIGWIIVLFKKMMRFAAKLPLAPIYQKQEKFNTSTVETLQYIIQQLENIEKEIKKE